MCVDICFFVQVHGKVSAGSEILHSSSFRREEIIGIILDVIVDGRIVHDRGFGTTFLRH